MQLVQLTIPDRSFAEKTALNINKNFAGQARVIDDCCYITKEYYEFCKDYVSKKCRTKAQERSK